MLLERLIARLVVTRDHLIARKGEQLPISDTNGCRGRGSRILEGTSAAAWGGSGHIDRRYISDKEDKMNGEAKLNFQVR